MQHIRTLNSENGGKEDSERETREIRIVARAPISGQDESNLNSETQLDRTHHTVSECTFNLIGEVLQYQEHQNQPISYIKPEQISQVHLANQLSEPKRTSTPFTVVNDQNTLCDQLDRIELHSSPQSQNDSNFKSLYDRLFRQIQDNQDLDEKDWTSLQNEYNIWEAELEKSNKEVENAIRNDSVKLNGLRKRKLETEKNRSQAMKQIHENKQKTQKLSNMGNELENLTNFLDQNVAVMKDAKQKSREINTEERENIAQLDLKLLKLLLPMEKLSKDSVKIQSDITCHLKNFNENIKQLEFHQALRIAAVKKTSAAVQEKLTSLKTKLAETKKDAQFNEELLTTARSNKEDSAKKLEHTRNNITESEATSTSFDMKVLELKAEDVNLYNELSKLEALKSDTESAVTRDIECIESKIKTVNEISEKKRRDIRAEICKLTDSCIALEVDNGKMRKRSNKLEFLLALSKKEEDQIKETIDEKSTIMNEIQRFLDETAELILQKKRAHVEDQEMIEKDRILLRTKHAELDLLDSEVTRAHQRLKELEEEVKASNIELEAMKAELPKVKELQARDEQKLDSLTEELSIRKGKIEEIGGLINSKRHHTTYLLGELTRNSGKKQEIHQISSNNDAQLIGVTSKTEDIENELKLVIEKTKSVNEKLETLTSEYNSTVKRIDKEKQLEGKLNLMTDTISCLKNKIECCDKNQKNLDRQLVYEENRLSDIKNELNRQEELFECIESEINTKNNSINLGDVNELISKRNSLQIRIDELDRGIQKSELEINRSDSLTLRGVSQLKNVVETRTGNLQLKSSLVSAIEILSQHQTKTIDNKKLSDKLYRKVFSQYESIGGSSNSSKRKSSECGRSKSKKVKIFSDGRLPTSNDIAAPNKLISIYPKSSSTPLKPKVRRKKRTPFSDMKNL